MRCSVYIAISLDGYIARPDGDLEWLTTVARPGEDYGYSRFFASVDTLIIGRKTYEVALGFASWPYAGKRVIVITHQPSEPQHDEHFYSGPPEALVRQLSLEGLQHAYIDGASVIQQFLAAGLVRQATLSVIPLLLGEGIRLFGHAEHDLPVRLLHAKTFESGLVQLKYELDPETHAPLDARQLSFRRLTRDDFPLLLGWFNAPHARRWYGRGETLEAVEAEYGPMVAGDRPTYAYIALLGERPVGLMEWCRFGDYPDVMGFYGVEDPDIVNCDVLIGEPDVAHRGLGAGMIRRFLKEKAFREARFKTCIIDPETENQSAIRAYEKAGFRHVRTVPDDGEGKPVYLMELRRDELTSA